VQVFGFSERRPSEPFQGSGIQCSGKASSSLPGCIRLPRPSLFRVRGRPRTHSDLAARDGHRFRQATRAGSHMQSHRFETTRRILGSQPVVLVRPRQRIGGFHVYGGLSSTLTLRASPHRPRKTGRRPQASDDPPPAPPRRPLASGAGPTTSGRAGARISPESCASPGRLWRN